MKALKLIEFLKTVIDKHGDIEIGYNAPYERAYLIGYDAGLSGTVHKKQRARLIDIEFGKNASSINGKDSFIIFNGFKAGELAALAKTNPITIDWGDEPIKAQLEVRSGDRGTLSHQHKVITENIKLSIKERKNEHKNQQVKLIEEHIESLGWKVGHVHHSKTCSIYIYASHPDDKTCKVKIRISDHEAQRGRGGCIGVGTNGSKQYHEQSDISVVVASPEFDVDLNEITKKLLDIKDRSDTMRLLDINDIGDLLGVKRPKSDTVRARIIYQNRVKKELHRIKLEIGWDGTYADLMLVVGDKKIDLVAS